MKKNYQLEDGGLIKASSPQEFVSQLRLSSKFDLDCTDQEYIKNFAQRYLQQTGAIIRIDNESNFMHDLEEVGYILSISD